MRSAAVEVDANNSLYARVVIVAPPALVLATGLGLSAMSDTRAAAWLAIAFTFGWSQLVGL